MKNSKLVMVVLVVLLILSVSYILYTEVSKYQLNKQISVYQQGAQAGFEQAVIQIAQQASTCQQVPLMVEDQTINLIAVECLQPAE